MKLFLSLVGFVFIFASCKKQQTLFSSVAPNDSGITFINDIREYDTFNILNTEFIYNGAGVAVGDLNGDTLEDLYFAGNQVDNKCYLNEGNFKFRDITSTAHVQKYPGQWSSGVNILDINGDGKKDIYVCNTLIRNADKRKNLLFINQGNIDGVPQFKELAAEYCIADTSYASHAQFFDYDRDGDLDLFIGTNYIDRPVPGQFIKGSNDKCDLNCDKLYRNDWDSVSLHPVFKDVSSAAGMAYNGYSHSTLIYDFNEDGWQDIYVANDYLSDDLMYINNHDGTFTNKIGEIFRHQSSSAMGSDLGDINNDGRMDVMTAEMLPFTNLRKKTLQGPTSYASYLYIKEYGYQYQYSRNTLQLNEGIQSSTRLPIYSDISFLSGVYETEWSWAPLFMDFDMDGFEDIYMTNGFPKDVTDRDFGEYRNEVNNLISDMDLQQLIPVVKVSNFMFQNKKDLTFNDVSKEWGLYVRSFSNGAAYADLDNDGDQDLIVQNIDNAPFLFKNNTLTNHKSNARHYLNVQLKGSPFNKEAIGAKIKLFTTGSSVQTRSVLAGRGYLSQSTNIVHFGLDTLKQVDSIQVFWPEGTHQTFGPFIADQRITLEKTPSNKWTVQQLNNLADQVFQSISPASLHLDYKHFEKDFIDFNFQKTIPHKMSQYGVPMAAGDINGDGMDDLILGGSARQDEVIFTQNSNGLFDKQVIRLKDTNEVDAEDAAIALFDADNDQDLDLVLASGSYENLMSGKYAYDVRFFLNDGKGNFTRDTLAINHSIKTNASVLRVADIDLDGDIDIFIGGHVVPGYYPRHDKSYILINQSSKGKVVFEDKTAAWAPELDTIGIINDAIWSDYNNDGKPDLVLAVEWGPLTILSNNGKVLSRIHVDVLDKNKGWWTSITSGDFDNDGDIDYVAGNFGQNVYFKCGSEEPITIYAKDFDQNGSLDPFISCYWRDTLGNKKEYFFNGRDEMIKQLIMIRRKFQKYTAFGLATVQDVFTKEEMKDAIILKASNLNSSIFYNLGNDEFSIAALPSAAQAAPLYGMSSLDLNQDAYLDLLLTGNDYGLELTQGRADAMQGLVLINDQKGGFIPISSSESGFFIGGDAKSMINLQRNSGEQLIINMINLDSLNVHTYKTSGQQVKPEKNENRATISFKNGTSRKMEFYPGNSFKSQANSEILLQPEMDHIQIENGLTKSVRTIKN